jgi:hypothetical protein
LNDNLNHYISEEKTMSKFRVSILASVFALVLAVAFSAPSHAQVSTEAVPKLLYVDSYFGTVANPSSQQAYFWGIVSVVGDSTYLATATDQYFGYVSTLKFASGTATFTLEGFNNLGSGYFTGTVQVTSAGVMTTVLKDYFSGATVYSSTLKKSPGFIYILK